MITVINIFGIIVEGISLYIFYGVVLGAPKLSEKRTYLLYAGLGCLNLVATLLAPNAIILSSLVLLLLFALASAYSGGLWIKIFSAIIYHAIAFLLESVVGFSIVWSFRIDIKSISTNANAYFAIVALSKFLLFGFAMIVFYYSKRKNTVISKKAALMLMALPLTTLLVICQIGYSATAASNKTAVLCYILLISSNLVVFYLFEKQTRLENDKAQSDFLREQVDLQVQHYRELYKEMRETRTLWHNMKNTNINMNRLILDGKAEAAAEMLKDMDKQLAEQIAVADTGNPQLDAVISAKQNQISYKISFKVDKLDVSDDVEVKIAMILAFALDNAIEAGEKVCEPKIDLSIIKNRKMVIIKIDNVFSGKLRTKGKRLLTTKADAQSHGFGIQEIKNIANEFSGDVSYIVDKELFCLSIFLHII